MASVDVSVEVLNECQIQEVTLDGQEIITQWVLAMLSPVRQGYWTTRGYANWRTANWLTGHLTD